MRPATETDLPRIVAIYNSTVASRQATADTTEVTVAARREWFARHHPQEHPLLVHEAGGKVVAWVSFEPFYGRPAYRHTAEISIYLAPEQRGQGLGRQLLQEALTRAAALQLKTILAYIFSHNEPSLRLFRSCGFSEWGRLPDIAEMDGRDYSLSILGIKLVNPSP